MPKTSLQSKQMKQVTRLQQFSSEIDHLKKLKSNLLQIVQHELNTPLTLIMGYIDLLSQEELGQLSTEQKQAVLVINKSANKLQTLLHRINALLLAHTNQTAYTTVFLSSLITEVVEARRSQAEQAGIKLIFTPPTILSKQIGDPKQLWHAFDCLLENALKFTPTGGQVEIKLSQENNHMCLTITDTGIGISSNELANIFNAFYQIDSSIARPYEGLGLGLTVAKAVIEAHQGQIEVASQPGQGAQFTVKLPVLTAEDSLDHPNQNGAGPKRILVVDDEKYITFMLREGLKTHLPDCEILVATTGSEALQLAESWPIDLLITDYRMTDIDGLALARYIRQMYPETGIVMLTAYSNNALRQEAAGITIQHVLDKPVKLAEIRQAVTEVLNNAS